MTMTAATTTPDRPMVRAIGFGRRFGDQWAIRDLDLELAPGEVFAFLGPNGAGKTTTVRLLTGLIGPSAGNAWLDGIDVVADPHEVRRRIGLLTETPSLYERLSAEENLDFFGRLHGLSAPVRARRGTHRHRRPSSGAVERPRGPRPRPGVRP